MYDIAPQIGAHFGLDLAASEDLSLALYPVPRTGLLNGKEGELSVTKGDGFFAAGYLFQLPDAGEWDAEESGSFHMFDSLAQRDAWMTRQQAKDYFCLPVLRTKEGTGNFYIAGPNAPLEDSPFHVYRVSGEIQNAYFEQFESGPPSRRADAYATMIRSCTKMLGRYTQWCAGEVYGVCVEAWQPDGGAIRKVVSDDSFSYIGRDEALETLRFNLAGCVKRLKPPTEKNTLSDFSP